MIDLEFTTIQDIKDILLELGYDWQGIIFERGKEKIADIEDFKYYATLAVKETKNNQEKRINISVTDIVFHIEKDVPEKKYDIHDHSLIWQNLMLERKNIKYARKLYLAAQKDKKEIEKTYKYRINLIKKQAENLTYQKAKDMAVVNTTILNAHSKINITKKAFEQHSENNLNT